ncbi:chalcone isomerase family protein [Chitinimonas lacunae]|uniref:Chalcone isomerase family protein n=1 Tax=Chitinimonas lacunae TaxID=1963018 RepID=A0ABV8MP53_9NEIS
MKNRIALFALLLSLSAGAAEIGGVKVDDAAKVGGQDLVLNGGGIRVKFGIAKVYVAALYAAQKSKDGDAVVNAATPRRISLTMLRNVNADDLHESLMDGLKENSSEAEMAALAPKIKEMNAIFAAVKEVKEKDVVLLDFLPGKGTQITVRGQVKDVIAGDDFSRALMRIWLGRKPVSSDLKKGMLGG